jgi:hypothetical protein
MAVDRHSGLRYDRDKEIAPIMRTLILVTALLLLAGLAGAQSMMPIPPFASTYSYPTHARGFYFQAPIDFTIVGVRVPDEAKHGKQNVAIIKLPLPPTPTNQTGGLEFYKGGEPSSKIIPCSLPFRKGDWVGILGACGDATMMHNSYGTSSTPFASLIPGHPTKIYRFCTNTNLVVEQGKGAYWANVHTIARVEVYVSAAYLDGSGSRWTGTTMTFTLSSVPDAGLPYQAASSLGNGPIPIDTRMLALTPDALVVLSAGGLLPAVFRNYTGKLHAVTGTAEAQLDIPRVRMLKGLAIHTAFVTLKASAPSGVSSVSTTFTFTIL